MTAKGQAYNSACEAYLSKCPKGNNDACKSTPILVDSLIDQLMPCATAPTCEDASACFDKVSAANTDSCKDWI